MSHFSRLSRAYTLANFRLLEDSGVEKAVHLAGVKEQNAAPSISPIELQARNWF